MKAQIADKPYVDAIVASANGNESSGNTAVDGRPESGGWFQPLRSGDGIRQVRRPRDRPGSFYAVARTQSELRGGLFSRRTNAGETRADRRSERTIPPRHRGHGCDGRRSYPERTAVCVKFAGLKIDGHAATSRVPSGQKQTRLVAACPSSQLVRCKIRTHLRRCCPTRSAVPQFGVPRPRVSS